MIRILVLAGVLTLAGSPLPATANATAELTDIIETLYRYRAQQAAPHQWHDLRLRADKLLIDGTPLASAERHKLTQLRQTLAETPSPIEAASRRAFPLSSQCANAFEAPARSSAQTLDFSQSGWLRFTAETDGWLELITKSDAFDPSMEVFDACQGSLVEQADDESGLNAQAQWPVFAGTTYAVHILRGAGFGDDGSLIWSVHADPPTLAPTTVPTGGQATGVVAGRVRTRANNTTIPSARVFLFDTVAIQGVNTDAAGRYRFTNVPTGQYYLFATGPFDSSYSGQLYRDIDCPQGIGTSCVLAEGETVTVNTNTVDNIDFSLASGGLVSGHIMDRNGAPLEGALIRILDEDGAQRASATSQADGTYLVIDVPAGAQYVEVQAAGFSGQVHGNPSCDPSDGCDPRSGTPLAIEPEAETPNIDFNLDRLGSIVGQITLNGAFPLTETVTYSIWRFQDTNFRQVTTRSMAAFEEQLHPGQYLVAASHSGFPARMHGGAFCGGNSFGTCDLTLGTMITVHSDQTSQVLVDLLQGAIVSGTVVDQSTLVPLPSVTIRALDASGRGVGYARTDAAGHYTIDALGPGAALLQTQFFSFGEHVNEAYPDTHCGDIPGSYCQLADGEFISLELGETIEGIDFSPIRGGIISGRIIDSITAEPLNSLISVRLLRSDGTPVNSTGLSNDGSFTFTRLATDDYYVITSTSGRYVNQLWNSIECPGGLDQGCQINQGTLIPVALGGEQNDIDFALRRLSSISGAVESATGQTGSVTVELYDDSGALIQTASFGSVFFIVEPGRYYLVAHKSNHVSALFGGIPCTSDPCDPLLGTPVDVGVNQDLTQIDFELDALPVFEVNVTDARDQRPLLAQRTVWNEDGSEFESTFSSSTIAVPPGRYRLGATKQGYIGSVFGGNPCNPNCDPLSGTVHEVALNQTITIDIPLTPMNWIGGRITQAGTNQPVQDIEVRLSSSRSAFTDTQGRYNFSDVPPGNYSIVTNSTSWLDHAYPDLPCNQACDPSQFATVNVVADTRREDLDIAVWYCSEFCVISLDC